MGQARGLQIKWCGESLDSEFEGVDRGNFSEQRAQMALLARKKGARVSEWSKEQPTEWRPGQVLNPETRLPFVDVGAWHFIADLLDAGEPLKEVELRKPPGKKAYEMRIISGDSPPIYIKLQLGAGKVICRSFHYSERE